MSGDRSRSGPKSEVFAAAHVDVEVLNALTSKPQPARITVINRNGALQTVGATSNDHLAVWPGIVYTSDGKARFGLPAGCYTMNAGRGFEYSLDSATIDTSASETARKTLRIGRQVPTTAGSKRGGFCSSPMGS